MCGRTQALGKMGENDERGISLNANEASGSAAPVAPIPLHQKRNDSVIRLLERITGRAKGENYVEAAHSGCLITSHYLSGSGAEKNV